MKRLICIDQVKEAAAAGITELQVEPNMLITDAARDYARSKGMTFAERGIAPAQR